MSAGEHSGQVGTAEAKALSQIIRQRPVRLEGGEENGRRNERRGLRAGYEDLAAMWGLLV